jgi:hypothetical protein
MASGTRGTRLGFCACRVLEPEEGAVEEATAKEASYEGNTICYGLIFIILFFRICSQQEAEAGMCQALQLCFYFGRRRRLRVDDL